MKDYEGPSELPEFPTRALPGTNSKMKIMEDRAALGLCLHHPEDGRFTPEINTQVSYMIEEIRDDCTGMNQVDIYLQAVEIISNQLLKNTKNKATSR